MPKKRNPYLSPQDIAALLSPQESLSFSPSILIQSPQTSISAALSNTLITSLIFSNLSTADIITCLKVCTAWNYLGQPHLWKSIAHYHTSRHHPYGPYDPVSTPPFEWWESYQNHRFLDTFDHYRGYNTTPSHSSSSSSGSRSRLRSSTFISAKQRDLICKNAFRVKSLRIDFLGSNLLDVPFTNLTRLSLGCRHGHTEDQGLEGVALELIARNPRLKELELSFVEYRIHWQAPSQKTPFAIRVLQVLQRHESSFSSSPSINNNNNNINENESGLYSLKLVWNGDPTMDDICSIFENCPSSLQELTIHTHLDAYFSYYTYLSTPDPQVIRKRFAALNNNIHHHHNLSNHSTFATNPPYRQRTPNLRLLNFAQYDVNNPSEPKTEDPETTFFPMLACFPDIQDLVLPRFSPEWTSARCADLISILTTTSCPALTNINFGENFIDEEHMFRFLMALPEGQLQGITMKIRPGFITHVLPTLLDRSIPASTAAAGVATSTLEVICLHEQDFERDHVQQRSNYIVGILASCPRLKTLVVVVQPKSGLRWGEGYSELQLSDLLEKEWVCSKLETLSIGNLELTAAVSSSSEHQGLDKHYKKEGDQVIQLTTMATNDSELAIYKRKIQTLTSFYLRLKNSLPLLKNLDLKWAQPQKNYIPFDCAVEYSNGIFTVDRLRWMGLSWWAIHGLETAAVQEAYQALSETERSRFSEYKMQGQGIYVYRLESEGARRPRKSGRWGRMYCCCSDLWESDLYEWQEMPAEWNEPVFEDLLDAYKSRGSRRFHEESKRRK